MNGLLFAAGLFGQVAPEAPAAALPWWREGWALWGIALLTIGLPTLLAWLLAKRLRAADMWGRIATVLVATAAGAVIVAMGWPPRLGIDLKGGVILVYQVDTARQSTAAVDDAMVAIEQVLVTPEGRLGSVAKGPGDTLVVRLETDDAGAREAAIQEIGRLQLESAELRPVGEAAAAAPERRYAVAGRAAPVDMDKLVGAVSRRVNPGGQKEVTVRRYGLDQLEVIVPEVDQAEIDLIKRIVSSAGVLEFRIVANPEDPRHRQVIEAAGVTAGVNVVQGGVPVGRWIELDTKKMNPSEQRGLVTRALPDGRVEVLVVLDRFDVTGGDLGRVSPGFDQNLSPAVNFTFNSRGAARFGLLTGQNVPDPANRLESRLGIVLDDVLQSAPTIRSAISSSGQITGNFRQSDIDFLVEVLNAGSLPAALESEPISEQKISPQLGSDTIRSGAQAMLLATIMVLTFMLLYYRLPGLVADLAVVLNILLVLALMISIKAAFTLAGLAGLVLSVGMSVDANVLIYERMREELERGAAVRMAIRNGFARAFSTIVDSNLTTLITGVVLFAIGTDQLKGFAVTLILGLTLNLFTAVFCSRVCFDLAERNRWLPRLSMAQWFGKTDLPFVRYMRPAIIASLLFILTGLAAAWSRGQGLFDIDFTGGTSVQVAFKPDQPLDVAAVRKAVAALPDVAVSSVTAGDAPAGTRYKIDTSLKDEEAVEAALRDAFPGRLATYSMGFGDVVSTAPAAAESQPGAAELTTSAALDFPERIARDTLRQTLEEGFAAAGHAGAPFELESTETGSRSRPVRTWTLSTALDPEATRTVLAGVSTRLNSTPAYLSANSIGGKVAGNTQVTAVYALLASLVMIVLYVWVRFQNVAFGLAAVVALAHDVLVAIACLALSHFVAPFMGWALVDDFKISLDVVAALLTIVGFSINDTIVIFDRLRELRGKARFVTADMVDRALNVTLSRTILTSGTTFLAALILYLFGGQGIHAFAFTMLVGVLVGSYSTIYIAAPIVLWLQHRTAGATVGGASPATA